MLAFLTPTATLLWLLYACWEWHDVQDNRIDTELRSVPSKLRADIEKFNKGIEGVRVDEIKVVHEAGTYEKAYVDGKETVRWKAPRDVVKTNSLASFFRCRQSGRELRPKLLNAVDDKRYLSDRYNLYYYADVKALFTKFGKDIRKFDINPELSRREKFVVREYDSPGPLYALNNHIDSSEDAVLRKHVSNYLTNSFLLKQFVLAVGLALSWFVSHALLDDIASLGAVTRQLAKSQKLLSAPSP